MPLLLTKIIKEPIKGGALEEKPRSNMMVGTITKSIATPERTANTEIKSIGGELVSNLSKLKFSKGGKTRNQENIKFIF